MKPVHYFLSCCHGNKITKGTSQNCGPKKSEKSAICKDIELKFGIETKFGPLSSKSNIDFQAYLSVISRPTCRDFQAYLSVISITLLSERWGLFQQEWNNSCCSSDVSKRRWHAVSNIEPQGLIFKTSIAARGKNFRSKSNIFGKSKTLFCPPYSVIINIRNFDVRIY